MSCETTTAFNRSASCGCTAAQENVFACRRANLGVKLIDHATKGDTVTC